jgi:hypothetical protein
MYNYQSQFCQDIWVDNVLNKINNGYFVDLGAHESEHISNSYFFEKERNWKGLAVEIDPKWKHQWIENRPSTIFICEDATIIDYNTVLKENNFPQQIDYLSIDLEPPTVTLKALYKIIQTDFIFKTITFETDYYREKSTREPSRELLKDNGYILIKDVGSNGSSVDDFYIHNSIYNSSFCDFKTEWDMI